MKLIKHFSGLLLILLALLSLSSCKALDEKKAISAYWADDSGEVIDWQGKKYILSTQEPGELGIRLYGGNVWVNETDVPALMNTYEGTCLTTDKDHQVLYTQGSAYRGIIASVEKKMIPQDALYIRVDLKEEIQDKLRHGKTEHYLMEWFRGAEDCSFLIPEETEKAINETLKSGPRLNYEELKADEQLSEVMFNAHDVLTIYPCDESRLFINGYINVFCGTGKDGREVSLLAAEGEDELYYVQDTELSLYRALKALYKADEPVQDAGTAAKANTKAIEKELGISLEKAVQIYGYDDHGGFDGDGQSLFIFDLSEGPVPENAFGEEAHWKTLPLSEQLSVLLCGGSLDGLNYSAFVTQGDQAWFPEIKNGYYYFRDRHPKASDPYSDTGVLSADRSSMNFTIAVYDTELNLLYYCEKDT